MFFFLLFIFPTDMHCDTSGAWKAEMRMHLCSKSMNWVWVVVVVVVVVVVKICPRRT